MAETTSITACLKHKKHLSRLGFCLITTEGITKALAGLHSAEKNSDRLVISLEIFSYIFVPRGHGVTEPQRQAGVCSPRKGFHST